MINVYCDESCHLENDNSDYMILGAISCSKDKVREVADDIRSIKTKHGLKTGFEIKWTKVSPGKIEFYKELIQYFWNNQSLQFRSVIATNKKSLENDSYNQTYDEWYYKMYYLLLSKMLDPTKQYNIYIDIKDTNGGPKVKKLKHIIDSFLYKFSDDCLKNIQIIKSYESELLQFCDLFIGAIGYKNRFLKGNFPADNLSLAKIELCNELIEYSGRTLEHTTPLSESKFNLFVWKPRGIR